ncbi:MAG: hypothetical protein IKS20_10860 [Victivallales bacterium]|nr:hypothetical protein [Victivallales bacterium]
MHPVLKLLFCSLRSEGRAHFYTLLAIIANSSLIMLHCTRIEVMQGAQFNLNSFGFGTALGGKMDFGDNVFMQQALSSVGMLILASLLIIFATRFLAVRCRKTMLLSLWKLGVTRLQLSCFLVLEALALALIGGFAGIVLGILCYGLVEHGSLFLPTMALSFTLTCILAVTMLANLPALALITRVSQGTARGITFKAAFWQAISGVASLSLMMLICFVPEYTNATRLKLFSCVGTFLFALGIAFFILPSIYLAEKAFNTPVSYCLGISPLITKHCCTGDKWRSVAGILAISSGLSIFLALHIWAASMLTMFSAPDTIPDALVRFHPSIAGLEARQCIMDAPFTTPGHIMDICVSQPNLDCTLSEKMAKANALGNNVITIGVKAHQAWGHDTFFRLPFIQGSASEAERCFLKGERACVIPDTMAQNAQLELNQFLLLESPYEIKPVEYKIVGIVRFPWAWFSKCSGLRIREARTSAVVFLPYHYVLYDFDAKENEFFWFNSNATHEEIDAYARDCADFLGLLSYDGTQAFSGGTRWDSGLNTFLVQTSTRESLNASLFQRSNTVINSMARIPLLALLLAGRAMACAVNTSILNRQRDIFIMRLLGASKFLIARSILAEALLLGVCACTLATFSAFLYASLANKLVDYAPVFGMISPPLALPLTKVLQGYAITLAISSFTPILSALTIKMPLTKIST